MLPVAFEIGPVGVYSYPIAMAAAFLACWLLARRLLPRRGIASREAAPIVFAAALGGLVGARALYVVSEWDAFAAEPLLALKLSEGGLVFYGGLAGGVLAVFGISVARRLAIVDVADVAGVSVPLGAAIGRIGCFLNGCCAGAPTDAWWAVTFPGGEPVHPAQLLDAAYNVVLFGVLIVLFRGGRVVQGVVWWLFLVGYAVARFLVETVRTTPEVAWGLSQAQLVSVAVVPIAVAGLSLTLRRARARESTP